MFKIGDLVEVHNPDSGFTKYQGKIGVLENIPDNVFSYYHVRFNDDPYEEQAFNTHEIRPAKNRIILDILNDL